MLEGLEIHYSIIPSYKPKTIYVVGLSSYVCYLHVLCVYEKMEDTKELESLATNASCDSYR